MSLSITWTSFKSFIEDRSVPIQYIDADDNYYLKAFDGIFQVDCLLNKLIQIDEVSEFENSYKNLSSTNSSPNAPGANFSTVVNTYVPLTGGTPTLVLADNPRRKYAYISNPLSATVTLQMGSSTGLTGTNRGLVLKSNDYFEIKGENLFTGDVYAYTTSNAITLSIAEGTL